MSWSFRIARILGIDVRIHLTFLLLLAWIGYSYYARGGTPAAMQGVAFILLLFLCVLLHEFGHAMAARRYGIHTPDITILPIGGVARLQRMPDEPWQEFVVAIAGPLVNVVIAAVLFVTLGGAGYLTDVRIDDPGIGLARQLMVVNVWLVLFNLIPAFPMDGGRVLRAILASRMNYARATQIAATVGQVAAFGFGLWGLFGGNLLLVVIAFFIYMGAGQEASYAQMRDVTRRIPVSEAILTEFRTLPATATLNDAVDLLLRTSQRDFPVVAPDGAIAGLLTREDLISGLRQHGPGAPVGVVMQRDVRVIDSRMPFDQAFALMQECKCPAVLVSDGRTGRLVGLLTPENVGEMMMVHSALREGGRPSWWRGGAGHGDGLTADQRIAETTRV